MPLAGDYGDRPTWIRGKRLTEVGEGKPHTGKRKTSIEEGEVASIDGEEELLSSSLKGGKL